MNGEELKCQKCGNILPADSNFCNKCGKEILPEDRIEGRQKLSLKYILISAAVVFVFMIIMSFVAAMFFPIYDSNMEIIPENFIIIASIGPAVGILVSTIALSFFIKYIKIKEVFWGAFFTIVVLKWADFVFAERITWEAAGIALLYCFAALFGAYIGDFLKKNIKIS